MAELVHECIRGTSASAEPASRSGASAAAGAGAAGMCGIYDVVVRCCPQLDGDDSVMMLVRLNAIAKQWQTDS